MVACDAGDSLTLYEDSDDTRIGMYAVSGVQGEFPVRIDRRIMVAELPPEDPELDALAEQWEPASLEVPSAPSPSPSLFSSAHPILSTLHLSDDATALSG